MHRDAIPMDRRKLSSHSPFSDPTPIPRDPFQNWQGTSYHHLERERALCHSFPGVSAIVAVSLPLPFPGHNLGKVASKLGTAVPVPFDDRFLLSEGERERASLETTVGILWRRTSPALCRFNSSKGLGATLVAVPSRELRARSNFLLLYKVGNSRMMTCLRRARQ
jgi:hypothetical protein